MTHPRSNSHFLLSNMWRSFSTLTPFGCPLSFVFKINAHCLNKCVQTPYIAWTELIQSCKQIRRLQSCWVTGLWEPQDRLHPRKDDVCNCIVKPRPGKYQINRHPKFDAML